MRAILTLATLILLTSHANSAEIETNFSGRIGDTVVSLPAKYTHLLECDNDKHFLDKTFKADIKRTSCERIRSFGFEDEYHFRNNNEQDTPESGFKISVNINTNSNYRGSQFIELSIPDNSKRFYYYKYRELHKRTFGLRTFAPIIDADQQRNRLDLNDKNIYIGHRKNGKADTFIICSNNPRGKCKLHFDLSAPLTSSVMVQFDNYHLSEWEYLINDITNLINTLKSRN